MMVNGGEGNVPEPGHLRMALVNMKCLYTSGSTTGNDVEKNRRNLEINIQRHLYFIDYAADRGAEFIGFPEISVQGYDFSNQTPWLKLDAPELEPIRNKVRERGVYVAIGVAEIDEQGIKRNTQAIIGPDGNVLGKYHKRWLTSEAGHAKAGDSYPVFDVKGARIGILICADATNFVHLEGLVKNGARILYAPVANSTGSTVSSWYHFRRHWAGTWDGKFGPTLQETFKIDTIMPSGGWINHLGVHGAIHNHAALYNPDFNPPSDDASNPVGGFASGARFIGPDGNVLAEMPPSKDRKDSKEYVLIHDIPIVNPSPSP
jgi:hypothetical protein